MFHLPLDGHRRRHSSKQSFHQPANALRFASLRLTSNLPAQTTDSPMMTQMGTSEMVMSSLHMQLIVLSSTTMIRRQSLVGARRGVVAEPVAAQILVRQTLLHETPANLGCGIRSRRPGNLIVPRTRSR
jgi:hypothetical protein